MCHFDLLKGEGGGGEEQGRQSGICMYFISKDKIWEGHGETSSCPKAVIADLFIYL